METKPREIVSDSEIRKNVLSMIIPVSIEGILQMISSTVLMAFLGRVDVLAVNAVGIGQRMTQLLWSFVKGMGVGITVCVARDVGAKKTENLKITSIVGMLSLICIVIFFSGLIALFAEPIVRFFGGSEETMVQSIDYMRIICIGLPFWTVMLCNASVLQGFGDAKTPMTVSVIYNIVNIGLGYLLIFGGFGVPAFGLYGAAWATVISQVLMCVLCIGIMLKKQIITNMFHELTKSVSNTVAQLRYLYKISLPSAFENMVWQLGSLAMMKPIISYGDIPYASHQLAMQAESISYMPTMGFGIATTSLVGRCFGAKDLESGHKYFKRIAKYMAIITTTVMVIMVVFRKFLMGILTPSQEIIDLGSIYLIITACTLIPQNLHGVITGALKGAGLTKPPMYISVICLWGIRVVLTYVFTYLVPGSTIHYVWIAMSIDIVSRFLMSSTYFRKKKIFKNETL
ncbi:MAG: MATE family efflux transporter [Clostridia bacterium]|nr:MATE family efflux transporter [Clostridia bacterium]